MPVIVQTVNKDGTVTNTRQRWTASELRQYLADARYEAESAGITVGNQPVSTFREEMPVWLGMLIDMQSGVGQSHYEYKPRGGQNVVLTPQQVLRCYQCFAWYVAACFATERQLAAMLDSGTDPEVVYGLIEWPHRNFEWEPQ